MHRDRESERRKKRKHTHTHAWLKKCWRLPAATVQLKDERLRRKKKKVNHGKVTVVEEMFDLLY